MVSGINTISSIFATSKTAMAHSRLYESSSLDLRAFLRSTPPEPTPLVQNETRPRPTPASSVRATAQARKPTTDTHELFARFPHLARLALMWGSLECRDFISGLILDTRQGTRQGFPAEHASTIFRLLQEHDADFPEFEPTARQSWGFGRQR